MAKPGQLTKNGDIPMVVTASTLFLTRTYMLAHAQLQARYMLHRRARHHPLNSTHVSPTPRTPPSSNEGDRPRFPVLYAKSKSR